MGPTGEIFSIDQFGKLSNRKKDWNISPLLNLVRIKSVGLCASDFSRIYDRTAYQYPLTPGHEIFGVVEYPSETQKFVVDQSVTVFPLLPCGICSSCKIKNFQLCADYSYFGSRTDGALATYLNVPDWNLRRISNSVPLRVGNQVEPLSVVIHALRKFKSPTSSQRLLISGGGFLSYLATEVAKYLGVAQICVATSSNERKAFFENFSPTVLPGEIDSDKFNCYLDFSGNFKTFENVCSKLRPNSEIVIAANRREDTYISQRAWNQILRKELSVQGTWNSKYSNEPNEDDWTLAIKLLETNVVRDLYPHEEVLLADLPLYLAEVRKFGHLNPDAKVVPRVSVHV
jgi:L-iditol 2-dehydrogenase